MLTTSKDKNQTPNSFSVDTDGVYFMINNSANGGICNIKSMFVGDFENQKVTLITAEGKITTIKKVGTICLVLKDNAGKNWSYDILDIVYDPESPYSLLGIPFLGRYFAKNDEANEFDNDTWITICINKLPFPMGPWQTSTTFCSMEAVIYKNY